MRRPAKNTTRRRERGFSLAEVMTATAIFAIIFIAALMMYDRSQRVYKQGVEASDMQQSTRVAFDKLVADIRMTGFDFDRDGTPTSSLANPWQPSFPYTMGNLVQPEPPNGHTYICTQGGNSGAMPPPWDTTPNSQTNETGGSTVVWREAGILQYQQPDEQIEYAGASVLGLRANFNFDTGLGDCNTGVDPCENGREVQYQSVQFPVVTTANDEIVTFALKPVTPPATAYPQLSFFADMAIPRNVHAGTPNRQEDPVNLPLGYDPCTGGCNSPPYTLYRVSFDESGRPLEIPVAENIRSMQLRYFRDTAATDEITTLPNGAGQFDPADPAQTIAERDTRSEIRAIRLALVGMNPQPDGGYTDPNDPIAPRHRKYTLETLIVPRNIGRHGMREFNVTVPGDPTLHVVCPGSCNAVYLTWAAPTTGGDVDTYNILYDVGNCASQQYTFAEDAGRNLDGYAAVWITPGQHYRFAVQAINKFGATTSNCIDVDVANTTRPEAPADLIATGGTNVAYPSEENKITIRWPVVTQNDDNKKTVTCSNGQIRDTKDIPPPERHFYRVYKSKNITFQPGDPGVTEVINEFSTEQPAFDGVHMVWTDRETANCTPYYYRVRAVDFCARNAAYNNPANVDVGISSELMPPVGSDATMGEARETLTTAAAPAGLAIASENCVLGICDLTLTWNAVTKDDPAGTDDIYIDHYRIRVEEKDALGNWAAPLTVNPQYDFYDGVLQGTISGVLQVNQYRFFVMAVDCLPGIESAPLDYPCDFTGTVSVDPTDFFGGTGVEADPWIVESPTALTFTSSIDVLKIDWTVYQDNIPVPGGTGTVNGPLTNATILVPQLADGIPARVSVSITEAGGTCSIFTERWILDQPAPACALEDDATNPIVMTWSSASDRVVNLSLRNASTDSLLVQKVVITWNRSISNGRADQLETVVFPTGTITANCAGPIGITKVDAPTNTFIGGGGNIPVTLNFRRAAGPIQQNPVTQVCIIYRTPLGDVLSCTIVPDAGTCTEPGPACQ
ncbi:MAG TPA: prepilin-type N-terminal cleavage/methylation domain-containing protein [Thermoanaerobaculia bacterium]|nr:prepilin-type N-terminal cleavage/methylation domain-containing protein [Thermoanaerobaculia bacterium]